MMEVHHGTNHKTILFCRIVLHFGDMMDKFGFALAIALAAAGGVTAAVLVNKPAISKRIPKLRLFYFDLPGKGEAIRLICAYSGIPLEDARLSREEFIKMKSESKLKFGQVPALQIDENEILVQSSAIMRYLGKLTGLYPGDPILAAKVDAIIDEENDLFTGLSVSRYSARFGFGFLESNKDILMNVRKQLNDDVLPRHLSFLESIASQSTTGWIANTKEPSIADFILIPRLQWLELGVNDGISTTILDKYPSLKAVMNKLLNHTKIMKYYKKDI